LKVAPSLLTQKRNIIFTMACLNLCENLSSRTKVGYPYYVDGRKYCHRCEIYLHYDGAFCPCCGTALRITPTSKRDKEKLTKDTETITGTSVF
jgi:hypothetical protein